MLILSISYEQKTNVGNTIAHVRKFLSLSLSLYSLLKLRKLRLQQEKFWNLKSGLLLLNLRLFLSSTSTLSLSPLHTPHKSSHTRLFRLFCVCCICVRVCCVCVCCVCVCVCVCSVCVVCMLCVVLCGGLCVCCDVKCVLCVLCVCLCKNHCVVVCMLCVRVHVSCVVVCVVKCVCCVVLLTLTKFCIEIIKMVLKELFCNLIDPLLSNHVIFHFKKPVHIK